MSTESPESTRKYACPCGNTTEFTGIDSEGYGGPDECDDGPECEESCKCLTELKQDFDVGDPDDPEENDGIDYHEFTGGSSDAEIGSYDKILCRACKAVIWEEPKRKVRFAMIAEIEATDEDDAQRILDAFREAAQPNSYGISLYRNEGQI